MSALLRAPQNRAPPPLIYGQLWTAAERWAGGQQDTHFLQAPQEDGTADRRSAAEPEAR